MTRRPWSFVLATYVRASVACALLGVLALVSWAPAAFAQKAPRVSSGSSDKIVEVGQPFSVYVSAMGSDTGPRPSRPELSLPPGFTKSGPSISQRSMTRIGSGGRTSEFGIRATWQVTASSLGKFVIPAPSVEWNGQRMKAAPITVEVVPVGKGPTRRGTAGGSPFMIPNLPGRPSPFGSPPGFPFDFDDEEEEDDDEPERDDPLRLDEALDDNVFLRAIADKNEAVVGEQITVSFYVYYKVDFEMTERHDAPMSDFVRHSLMKVPNVAKPTRTVVGRRSWEARLVDKVAIFPLRAGNLETGSMTSRFTGRRIGSNVLRKSNSEKIRVTEPPADGRPNGYRIGDVGSFSIRASVSPRAIEQGGSVGVTLRVSGEGNMPTSLDVPGRKGIEWLDPEKTDQIEADDGVLGGTRTFGYVVRIKESGDIDLGDVELSFWNPKVGGYETTSAELGTVEVKPTTPSDEEVDAARLDRDRDPFANMPGPRAQLGRYTPALAPLVEGTRFWGMLLSAPLLVVLVLAGSRVVRRARERRAETKLSAAKLARQALSEAAKADKADDAKELAAAVERAVHHAIDEAVGLKSRGVLLSELPTELEERGVTSERAAQAHRLLEECESMRFAPDASEGERGDLRSRARELVDGLLRDAKKASA